MKRNIFYLLPLLIVLAAACSPKSSAPVPVPAPIGTFSGKFAALIKKPGGFDTLRDSITLKMLDTTKFNVTTAIKGVHALSSGIYAYNGYYIQFNDATAIGGANPKFHLSGVYQYYYDGSIFQMVRSGGSDTLTIQYNLKKVN